MSTMHFERDVLRCPVREICICFGDSAEMCSVFPQQQYFLT